MRRALALLAMSLLGCSDMMQQALGGADAGADAQASDAGAEKTPCKGFRDIDGNCYDHSCLDTPDCNAGNAAVACAGGVDGQGSCISGVCAYPNAAQGCTSAYDCPCGFCGPEGRCYGDRHGGCGSCAKNPNSPSAGVSTPACKGCLADCQGLGPQCCSGCGCICEDACGLCK